VRGGEPMKEAGGFINDVLGMAEELTPTLAARPCPSRRSGYPVGHSDQDGQGFGRTSFSALRATTRH